MSDPVPPVLLDSSGACAATAVPPAVAVSRHVAVACLLALAVLCLAWEMWWAPLRPGGSWAALKALPLLLPLVGLWRYRLYTYRWVSLVLWLYFTEGCVRLWSDPAPARWLALVELVLCLALFAACAVHVRQRLRAGRAVRCTGSGAGHSGADKAETIG